MCFVHNHESFPLETFAMYDITYIYIHIMLQGRIEGGFLRFQEMPFVKISIMESGTTVEPSKTSLQFQQLVGYGWHRYLLSYFYTVELTQLFVSQGPQNPNLVILTLVLNNLAWS